MTDMIENDDAGNGLDFISYSEAARRLPRIDGRQTHGHTVARWARNGVKVHGETIKLRAARVGRQHVTTQEWLEQFLEVAGR